MADAAAPPSDSAALFPALPDELFVRETFANPSYRVIDFVAARTDPFVERGTKLVDEGALTHCELAKQLSMRLSDVSNRVQSLIHAERRNYASVVSSCRDVELKERGQLQFVRSSFADIAVRLADVQDKLTTATALTAGVEQQMALASGRVARGRSIHELIRLFSSMTKMGPEELEAILRNKLSVCREQQRARLIASWAKKGASVKRGAAAAPLGAKTAQGDGARKPGSLFLPVQSYYPQEAADEAETSATSTGIPAVFARRSTIDDAIDWMSKLQLVANELDHAVPNAKNISFYMSWLAEEIKNDFMHAARSFWKACDATLTGRVDGDDDATSAVMDSPMMTASFTNASLLAAGGLMAIDPIRALDIVAGSFYGRCLLQAAEQSAALYAKLTSKGRDLFDESLREVSREVVDAQVKYCDFTAPPALPHPSQPLGRERAALVIPSNKMQLQGLAKLFKSFLKREMLLVQAAFPFATNAKEDVVSALFYNVWKPGVGFLMKLAQDRFNQVVEEEARSTPRTKRRNAERYIDAQVYQLSIWAETKQASMDLLEFLLNQEEVATIWRGTFETMFIDPDSYCRSGAESVLLQRHTTFIKEFYFPRLSQADGRPYEVFTSHVEKSKDVSSFVHSALTRAKSICGDTSAFVQIASRIAFEAQSWMAAYVEEELKKVMAFMRTDADTWLTRPKEAPQCYLQPSPDDAHQRALKFISWSQSVVVEIMRLVDTHLGPSFATYPPLRAQYEQEWTRTMTPVNDLGIKITTMCCHAITCRALNVLMVEQKSNDYAIKDNAANSAGGAVIPTKAATYFSTYVAKQIEMSQKFIESQSFIAAGANARTADGSPPEPQPSFHFSVGVGSSGGGGSRGAAKAVASSDASSSSGSPRGGRRTSFARIIERQRGYQIVVRDTHPHR